MAELNSSPEKNGGKIPRKKLSARVDLTAMVDLAFLLITFFMLTTSLQKPKMFHLTMPDKPDVVDNFYEPESRTMTICLGKNDQVMSYLGLPDKPLTPIKITTDNKTGIRKAIMDTKNRVVSSTGRDLIVIIKPSAHSVYNNLVNVLDELSIADVSKYAVTDIQPKDIEMLKQHNAY